MKKIVSFVIAMLIVFTATSVFAATTYNMKLKAENTEIEVGQDKIVFYIDLTQYSGDGLLGYEGVLEFDKDVFESALVESLNDWDRATYDTTTGKIISTTSVAQEGKDIAKITLTIKENVNKDKTEVKINNFTLSDGNIGDTFNEKITYTFKKNSNNTQTNTTSENTTSTIRQTVTNQRGTNTEANTNANTNTVTTQAGSTTNGQTNTVTGNTTTTNTNTVTTTTTETPIETTVQQSTRENTTNTTTTEGTKKIETVGELKEDDTTKAQNKIPQTGSTAAGVVTVVVIAIIGVAAFIRFKTIRLK